MTGNDNSTRRLTSWIESFVEYTEGLNTPPIFRRWAAVCAVSAVLERKVWIENDLGIVYPNLYVLLVGPPGVGKGEALKTLRRLWEGIEDFHIASSTVSYASMVDELKEAHRQVFSPTRGLLADFHSLQVASVEFGSFMPSYDLNLMNFLQEWYDCTDKFAESRRGRAKGVDLKKVIKNPQLGMIAGTTPDFLGGMLPEGAWNQGFCARTIMVHSSLEIQAKFYGGKKRSIQLFDDLLHDLRIIHELYGEVKLTDAAQEWIQDWYNKGRKPEPTHPRLHHYKKRRPLQLFKLAMVICLSRSSTRMAVGLSDMETALGYLEEAEATMPGIFDTMITSGDASAQLDTLHFILTEFLKSGPVPEHKIINYISHHTNTPAYNVVKVMDMMVQGNLIKVHAIGPGGRNTYKPA